MCDWVVLPRHSCRDCGIQSNAIGISSGLAHPPFCDLVFKHGIETKVDPVSLRVNVCSCLSTVIFFLGQFALEIILVVGIKDVQLMNGFIVLQNFLPSALFLAQSSKMTFESLSPHAGKYHTCQAIIFPVLWTSRFIVNWFESIFVIRQVSDLSRCELRSRGIPFIKGNNWRMLVEYVALETSFPRTCVHLPHSTLSKT